jgi:hypothetical protein
MCIRHGHYRVKSTNIPKVQNQPISEYYKKKLTNVKHYIIYIPKLIHTILEIYVVWLVRKIYL